MRALCFVDGERLRVQSYNERDVTVSWPELAGLPDALPATTALLDGELVATDDDGRPSFGLLQQRMHVADPAEVAAPRGRGAGGLRRVRPAPPRRPRPHATLPLVRPAPAARPGARARARAGACSPLHDDGPALLAAADERGPRGRRGQAARLPLRAGQAHAHVAEGEGAAPPGDGGGRLAARRGQPHRAHRRAARRLPRRARRRRPAALRRAGRHRLQGRRARRGSAGCSPTSPPTSAPSTRRRPAPRSSAARAGCGPSWSPSSSSASGPTTTACATRATSACATTRPPPT